AACRAVAELRAIGSVAKPSSPYVSAPRALLDQPDFSNAALELQTDLTPEDLLVELKRLELALGRDPQGLRFGPRLLDLDILAIDGKCVTEPDIDLIVPIHRIQQIRF